jgi:hypothetical protein
MFNIGIPEIIILLIVAFLIFCVATAFVLVIYLMKKFRGINTADRKDVFCPKCGTKIECK